MLYILASSIENIYLKFMIRFCMKEKEIIEVSKKLISVYVTVMSIHVASVRYIYMEIFLVTTCSLD